MHFLCTVWPLESTWDPWTAILYSQLGFMYFAFSKHTLDSTRPLEVDDAKTQHPIQNERIEPCTMNTCWLWECLLHARHAPMLILDLSIKVGISHKLLRNLWRFNSLLNHLCVRNVGVGGGGQLKELGVFALALYFCIQNSNKLYFGAVLKFHVNS